MCGVSQVQTEAMRAVLQDTYARGKAFLRYGFVLIVLGFLAVFVYRQWHTIQQIQFRFSLELLAISSLLASISLGSVVLMWHRLLNATSRRISYLALVRVFFLSNLAKYIPGTVWTYMGIFYLLEKEGTPRSAALNTLVIWQVVNIAAGLFVSTTLLPTIGLDKQWLPVYYALVPAVIIGLIIFQPAILQRLLNLGLRLLRRPTLVITGVRVRDTAIALVIGLWTWGIYGLAFFLFCNSLFSIPWSALPIMIGAFAFSYVAGFIAPFAPAGLGVREGVLVALLTATVLPAGPASVVTLLSRLWLVGVELLCTAVVVLMPSRWTLNREVSHE